MFIQDWLMRRSIAKLVNGYIQIRSAGTSHPAAFEHLVLSWSGLSTDRQNSAWVRFKNWQSDSSRWEWESRFIHRHRGDLQRLIHCMLLEYAGGFDGDVSSWYTEQEMKAFE